MILIPHTLLFQSDQFWANANRDVLRKLVSTCKGFRAELLNKGEGPTLFDHALLTLTRHEPTLSLHAAKYRFSLKIDAMVKHCAALPEEDKLYISEEELKVVKYNHAVFHIRFIDAYRMACKNGLKAAMERRHRFETKVLHSGRELAAALNTRFLPLFRNTKRAAAELRKNLDALRKDSTSKKRVPGENELRKQITLLEKLNDDLAGAHNKVGRVYSLTKSATPRIREIEMYVTELKRLKKTLAARYRTHAVYCPEQTTLDCLAKLE